MKIILFSGGSASFFFSVQWLRSKKKKKMWANGKFFAFVGQEILDNSLK
jgi:hypothetical protein